MIIVHVLMTLTDYNAILLQTELVVEAKVAGMAAEAAGHVTVTPQHGQVCSFN